MSTESRTERLSRKDNDTEEYKTIMSIRLTYQGMMMAVMAAVALGVILFLFFKKENTREYTAEEPKVILAGSMALFPPMPPTPFR